MKWVHAELILGVIQVAADSYEKFSVWVCKRISAEMWDVKYNWGGSRHRVRQLRRSVSSTLFECGDCIILLKTYLVVKLDLFLIVD